MGFFLEQRCTLPLLNQTCSRFSGNTLHLLHESSLHRLAREAMAKDLHFALSVAMFGAVFMVNPLSLRSLSIVRLHVFFGRPLFLGPS